MSTALMTIHSDDTVEDADFEMKMANIRHIPVVGHKNELIGIVSQRDLLRALVRTNRRRVSVGDIMTRAVHTVDASEPASHAVDVLLEYKIGCVPVLGEQGDLVGIITETDFLRIARDALWGRA
jgi:CBS domain-containing protein